MVDIASSLFDLTSATYNGAALVLPLTVPISASTLVINNAKNILAVPTTPPTSGLTVYTTDSASRKVAQSLYDASSLSPDTPTTGLSFTFTRSNIAISGVGSLTVAYTPRFPTAASTLKFTLPTNQMKMLSNSCQMQTTSLVNCQVLSSTASVISVSYQNQTNTILTNLSNVEPNNNQLTV